MKREEKKLLKKNILKLLKNGVIVINYDISFKEKIFYIVFFLHQLIMYFIFCDEFISYFKYIPFLCVGVFFAIKLGEKIYLYFIVLIMVIFIYSISSYWSKNPSKFYDDNLKKSGYFTIIERREKTRMIGSITSQDKILEPINYNDLYLKGRDKPFIVKCSLLEKGCKFYNDYESEIYIEYIAVDDVNYAFLMKKGSDFISFNYFKENYNKERLLKLNFIIFYEVVFILMILFFYFKMRNGSFDVLR